MNKHKFMETKKFIHNNALQFRLNRINKTKVFFISEINEREKIMKIINKYVEAFDYTD